MVKSMRKSLSGCRAPPKNERALDFFTAWISGWQQAIPAAMHRRTGQRTALEMGEAISETRAMSDR
jgi:hypothetical protein